MALLTVGKNDPRQHDTAMYMQQFAICEKNVILFMIVVAMLQAEATSVSQVHIARQQEADASFRLAAR